MTTSKKFTHDTIAMVYDFDGTLTPKAMQDYTLLPKLSIPSQEFWEEVRIEVASTGAENMLVYMRLLLEKARERNINITPNDYRVLANKIRYFPGVEDWFNLVNNYIKKNNRRIKLKHYIVSAGMREILEGVSIKKYFSNIFASQYYFDKNNIATFPKLVITDTTKTQYLFRINKGKEDLSISINEHMPEHERQIPFSNMIYIGDGMTDVPSMALTKKQGGHTIAVYKEKDIKQKKTCRDLLAANRVDFIAKADYRENSELFKRTALLLDSIMTDIEYKRELFKCKQQNSL